MRGLEARRKRTTCSTAALARSWARRTTSGAPPSETFGRSDRLLLSIRLLRAALGSEISKRERGTQRNKARDGGTERAGTRDTVHVCVLLRGLLVGILLLSTSKAIDVLVRQHEKNGAARDRKWFPFWPRATSKARMPATPRLPPLRGRSHDPAVYAQPPITRRPW